MPTPTPRPDTVRLDKAEVEADHGKGETRPVWEALALLRGNIGLSTVGFIPSDRLLGIEAEAEAFILNSPSLIFFLRFQAPYGRLVLAGKRDHVILWEK